MNEALGLLETIGLTPTLVAIDAMEKSADIRVIQCELNDFYGVCTKIAGATAAVSTAIEAGRRVAEQMGGSPVADVILAPDPEAMTADRLRPRIQSADRTRRRLLSRNTFNR